MAKKGIQMIENHSWMIENHFRVTENHFRVTGEEFFVLILWSTDKSYGKMMIYKGAI